MIGRGASSFFRSVPRTVIERLALGRQVLMDPTQLLTQQPDLAHALIMLTLSTGVRAILSHMNRHHAITDLPRELVDIVPEVAAVVILHLGAGRLC